MMPSSRTRSVLGPFDIAVSQLSPTRTGLRAFNEYSGWELVIRLPHIVSLEIDDEYALCVVSSDGRVRRFVPECRQGYEVTGSDWDLIVQGVADRWMRQ